jgi:hypothetical protein
VRDFPVIDCSFNGGSLTMVKLANLKFFSNKKYISEKKAPFNCNVAEEVVFITRECSTG